MLAMSAVISLMQIQLGMRFHAIFGAFAIWCQRPGSATVRCMSSAIIRVTMLYILLLSDTDLRRMRTFAYIRVRSDPRDSMGSIGYQCSGSEDRMSASSG